MSRRSWGEGSVYPASDGSGWIAALELPATGGGKRKRKRRRARTKSEAQQLLRAMKAEADQYGDLADGKRLISATVEDYLRMRQRQRIAPQTILSDEWAATLIVQGLGHRRIATVSVHDCDRFLVAAEGQYGGLLGRTQIRRLRQKLSKMTNGEGSSATTSPNCRSCPTSRRSTFPAVCPGP